jgi:hypothetical protein
MELVVFFGSTWYFDLDFVQSSFEWVGEEVGRGVRIGC